MSRKSKTETEIETALTPLLVAPEIVARLLSSPQTTVEQLIKEGYFGTRTVAGRRLVRYADVLEFVARPDPEPINYEAVKDR